MADRHQPSDRQPTLAVTRRVSEPEHALIWRSRLLLIPNSILARFLDAYSNSLCRSQPGRRAAELGAYRVDGCNFMIDVGYRHELPRLNIETSLGYGRLFMPDSNWLGKGEKLPSADFMQVHLHILSAMVTLSRDFPIARRWSTRWSWRVGGQLGLAFLAGDVKRTKLGDQTEDCAVDDLGDLDRCRPYRAIEFNDEGRDPQYFARCDSEGCDELDLERAGRYAEQSIPRVLPLGGVFTGPRVRINQKIGIAAEFGVGVGLTVGVSIDGYFSPDGGLRHADRSDPDPEPKRPVTRPTGGEVNPGSRLKTTIPTAVQPENSSSRAEPKSSLPACGRRGDRKSVGQRRRTETRDQSRRSDRARNCRRRSTED